MASLRARRILLTGAAVLALVLVACGGSTKAASAPKTTTTTNRAGRLAAFRTCMAQQGVDLPADFTFGGFGGRRGAGSTDTTGAAGATDTTGTFPTTTLPPGVTAQQYRTALQACASTLGTPGGGAANNPQVMQYRDCLNQYLTSNGGTTLPSTGAGAFGGFGGGFFGGGGGNGATTTSNPLMQAALNHCASLRPTFTGRGGTTSTTAKA